MVGSGHPLAAGLTMQLEPRGRPMIISAVDANHDPDSPVAQAARDWFAVHGPADLQPLPLGYGERERCQGRSGAHHILKWYARSLASNDYDVDKHPSFDDFARGVMAEERAPSFTKNDPDLNKRFPPCPLEGLDAASLVWRRPERPRGRPRKVQAEQGPLAVTPEPSHDALR